MKHEYADGSARYGTPPFPKLSPKEEAAGKQEPEETKDASNSIPVAAVSPRRARGAPKAAD